MTGWSYRSGEWYAVLGPRVAVVLPPDARDLAAALWALVDDGAAPADVVDALLAGGLSALPDLALVAEAGGRTTVLVRGRVRVRLMTDDDVEEITAGDALTWVERSVAGVALVRIDADGLETTDETDGSLAAGLVRIGSAEHAAAADHRAESDHDGLTSAGLEDTGLMPPLPGIPGQPPAPPVTARPVARLLFSSGEDVAVDRAVLVGRAPTPGRLPTLDQPRLIPVHSPQQEVSSTHLEVRPGSGADHGSAVATDLGSTNGTLLRQPGLPTEGLRAGVGVQLVPGAVLDLGDGVTIEVVDA